MTTCISWEALWKSETKSGGSLLERVSDVDFYIKHVSEGRVTGTGSTSKILSYELIMVSTTLLAASLSRRMISIASTRGLRRVGANTIAKFCYIHISGDDNGPTTHRIHPISFWMSCNFLQIAKKRFQHCKASFRDSSQYVAKEFYSQTWAVDFYHTSLEHKTAQMCSTIRHYDNVIELEGNKRLFKLT